MRACAAVRSGLKLRYLLLQPRDVRRDSLLLRRRRPCPFPRIILASSFCTLPYFHRTFTVLSRGPGTCHNRLFPPNLIVFGKSSRVRTRASGPGGHSPIPRLGAQAPAIGAVAVYFRCTLELLLHNPSAVTC